MANYNKKVRLAKKKKSELYGGPAINELVAKGGWGWGGAKGVEAGASASSGRNTGRPGVAAPGAGKGKTP